MGRVVPARPEGKRPAPGRDQFSHGHAIAGDENLFAFEDEVEKLREVRFSLVDVEGRQANDVSPVFGLSTLISCPRGSSL
jgi:hypothetical protein